MTPRRAHGPRRARWLASLLALLALVGQLASVAHEASVRHVTCAEHGEQVDVVDRAANHADVGDDTAVANARPPAEARWQATPRPAHGHEHCHILGLRRQHVVVATPATQSLPPHLVRARFDSSAALAPPRAIALLAVAPKGSPPSRG